MELFGRIFCQEFLKKSKISKFLQGLGKANKRPENAMAKWLK